MAKLCIIYIKKIDKNIKIHKIAPISLHCVHKTPKIYTTIKTSKYCTDKNSQVIEEKKEKRKKTQKFPSLFKSQICEFEQIFLSLWTKMALLQGRVKHKYENLISRASY